MNLTTRMIVVLTAVGLVSGVLLATVGILTQERIEENRQEEIKAAITRVVPETSENRILYEDDDMTVYGCLDSGGNEIGYAILASGTGFQDIITLMVGTNPELTRIRKLTIIDQKETPGLGAKIVSRDAFLQYWDDKDVSNPLSLHKPAVSRPAELTANEVNTITGATISSQKVLGIVSRSVELAKSLKEEGKFTLEDPNGS